MVQCSLTLSSVAFSKSNVDSLQPVRERQTHRRQRLLSERLDTDKGRLRTRTSNPPHHLLKEDPSFPKPSAGHVLTLRVCLYVGSCRSGSLARRALYWNERALTDSSCSEGCTERSDAIRSIWQNQAQKSHGRSTWQDRLRSCCCSFREARSTGDLVHAAASSFM